MVQLECHELKGTDEWTDDLIPILKSKGENILAQGVMNVVADNLANYGFKVTNKTNLPLYAALFYFDMSDLSITSYYEPNKAQDGNVDPSISARGSLTIGYGSGGFPPRTFYLRDDQDFDIGFLKLFVSTKPADFSHIAQSSPFSRDRGSAPPSTPNRLYLWDSILVVLVQRRPMN